MKVNVSFEIDTDAWSEDHDTEGMLASEVRRDIREIIDEIIRKDRRMKPYVLPAPPRRPRR